MQDFNPEMDDERFQEIIIHNIRLKMNMKNMIPADLARVSGISKAAISKMLRKQINIGLISLKKIADALEVQPAELLEFTDFTPAEEIFSPADYRRAQKARKIFEEGFPPIKCLAITGRSWLHEDGYYHPAVINGFQRFPRKDDDGRSSKNMNFQFCLLDPLSPAAMVRAAKEERHTKIADWTMEKQLKSKLYTDAVISIRRLYEFTKSVAGLRAKIYSLSPYCTILSSCSALLYEPYHLGRESGWDLLGTEMNPVVLFYNHTNRMFRILQDHFDFYFDNGIDVEEYIRSHAGTIPEFGSLI